MSLEDDAERLKNQPIFSSFGAEQLRLVAFSAETVQVPAKTILFREGEPADGGCLLVSGQILLRSSETGQETLIDEPGTLLGELALLTEITRPATAATVTDCTLMMLSRRLLRRVLEEYPAMAEVMRMALAERLHALSADLSKLHPEFSRK